MAEPELRDVPETAPGLEPAAPAPREEPPLDEHVLPNPTPPSENYHVAIWDVPPTFACLRCALRGVTLDEITYHLDAAHGEVPVPTSLAAQYSDPSKAPASGQEALMAMVGTGETAQEQPTPETPAIAETVTAQYEENPV